jgi:arabinose-5-phosphate isomerase
MSNAAAKRVIPHSHVEQLRQARAILRSEAGALEDIAGRLDSRFCDAAELIFQCAGHVVVCGMGKAGLIGQKITATLSSTGTRSIFLHPAEAVHGDLGCLHRNDVFLALSNSGETDELCQLIPVIRQMQIPVAKRESTAWHQQPVPRPCWRSAMRWRWSSVNGNSFRRSSSQSFIPVDRWDTV